MSGRITKCKMFLNSFFSSCGDLPDVEPREVYLLRKCQGDGPLSWPLPTWTCLDLLTPNPRIRDPQITPGTPVYHSSSLTFRLMTVSEHYLVGTQEVANIFIPLEFSKGGDTKSHWHRTSMSWHNGMCGWVQFVSKHMLAHHSELLESLGNTTIAAAPNTLIETVAPPSFEFLSRISSATSITHVGNPMNTHQGLGSTWSKQGFASNPFQAEVPKGFTSWADYLDAKIPCLTSTAIASAFTKGCESMQCTASLVTEVFDQYIIARLAIIAARFKCKIDSVNKNIDWK